MATNGEIEVEASSGNVVAELGLADPQAYLAKAELVRIVRQTVKARGWTQRKAADGANLPLFPDREHGELTLSLSSARVGTVPAHLVLHVEEPR